MTQINSYLTFNGNCREAMNFYKSCLGGELTFQTIGESPLSDEMPERMQQCIVHATLKNEGIVLMASDMVDEKGLRAGNAVSLMLNCSSEEQARTVYKKLSTGGQQTHPIEPSFRGGLFGDLTDKYGHHWLVNYSLNIYN